MMATRNGRVPVPSHVGGASAADGPVATSFGAVVRGPAAPFAGVAFKTTFAAACAGAGARATSGGGAGACSGPDNAVDAPADASMVTSVSTARRPTLALAQLGMPMRSGSRPARIGASMAKYEITANVSVARQRSTNRRGVGRPVRCGVSHKKIGQWKRYAP